MKVDPNLFAPNRVSPRQNGDASEARRAFEMMLSASSARTRASAALPAVGNTIAAAQAPQSVRAETEAKTAQPAQFARPGRVLDIKV